MANLTPEQLAEKGLELVAWSSLAEVKLDAWYRWKSDGRCWTRIRWVDMEQDRVMLEDNGWMPMSQFKLYEHSTDNGKTWHPCAKVRPIGGRLEHEKILREDLRPNQEAK